MFAFVNRREALKIDTSFFCVSLPQMTNKPSRHYKKFLKRMNYVATEEEEEEGLGKNS